MANREQPRPRPPAPPRSALAASPQPELRRFWLWSGAAHALLLGTVLGYSAWTAAPRVDLNQKPIHATLVRRGQARDAKLLPRIEEPPPPPKKVEAPPPPAPPPPEAPSPVAVPSLKPPPAPPSRAAPSPGANDADGRRSRLFDAFQKTGQKAHDEPLAGAEDGDPEGDSATAEGDPYLGLLSRNVHRYYDVSQSIPDQERLRLRTDVFLKLGPSGAVEAVKLASRSGNELFDNAVLAAVKRAQPFPAPPAHLRDKLHAEGVVLRFTP
ncbi:MAG TPA: TonB family protein [Myxococcales bacterium]|jgi:TonB family protein|nr:TonB family protein [Myxococcales bacterium]